MIENCRGLLRGKLDDGKLGDNQSWSVEQPRFRLKNHTPRMHSPAEELHDLMRRAPKPFGQKRERRRANSAASFR